MRRRLKGDTLIEVLFAFAILSAVIGTAFSGAMGSYKSAVVAQQRTQAQLLAQYQADGLLTYRNSLAWDWDSTSGLPSFLNGDPNSNSLIPVANIQKGFCMQADPKSGNASAPYSWNILTDDRQCSDLAVAQAPNLINPIIAITPGEANINTDKKAFTITVSWQAANAKSTDQRETATRSVILTDK